MKVNVEPATTWNADGMWTEQIRRDSRTEEGGRPPKSICFVLTKSDNI